MTKSIEIPFVGFYETTYGCAADDWFDRELDWIRETVSREGLEKDLDQLSELFYWKTDWKKFHEIMSKRYVSDIEDILNDKFNYPEKLRDQLHKIKLEFESLDSPKYYNYSTDRIFAKIDKASITYMYQYVGKDDLNKKIEENFTSRDGFSSFYPNQLQEWERDVLTWDHNQLRALLETFLDTILEKPFADHCSYWDIMESWDCNGGLADALFKCTSEEFNQLYDKLKGEVYEAEERFRSTNQPA